jgi:hypothetical protein
MGVEGVVVRRRWCRYQAPYYSLPLVGGGGVEVVL